MLAPKSSKYNGRPTFANPIYLKKAQSEKSCLYEIPYDKDDLANIFAPDREDTLTLEQESRSKLYKGTVKPYDYTNLDQLAHANQIRKKMWRKTFVKHKPNIFKNIDAHTELQCLYLYKIKECECLVEKLSKQTETLSIEVYNELLRSLTKLEQHSISLEIALQQCQEQMKNDTFCKQNGSIVFLKEREQYSKIQDLKAQLQDKNIAIKEAKKKAQLQKDKALNPKPSVITPARLPNTTNGSKPKHGNTYQQPRNWPPSMSSQCIYSANHDECILKYISKVNSRASAQNKDVQSHKTTKRYIAVEKKSDSKKHDRQIPTGQKFSPNKSFTVYLKTTPPRYGLTWKPTGRIFTYVGLRWIPIRESIETFYNMNDSASPLRKKTHNPNTTICVNSSSLSAGTSKASEPISSQGSSNGNILSLTSLYKHSIFNYVS
ncbi:hypothetical protein Tco_0646894 [Tanacetum coccineum]